MPELILPGVFIETRAEALIVPGPISVGNIGIVGTARQGPIGEVKILSSLAEAREIFGATDAFDNPETASKPLTLVRALELAYANGASTVFAVRVTKTETAAAGENFIAAWNLNTTARKAEFKVAGDTVAATTAAILKAATHGSWGNSISVNVFDAEEESFIAEEQHDGPAPITLTRKPVAVSARNKIRVLVAITGQTKVFTVVYVAPTAGQVQINTTTGALTFFAGEAPAAGDKLFASYVVPMVNSRKVSIRAASVTESYTVADGAHLVQLVNDADAGSALVKAVAGANPEELPKKHNTADDFREFGKGTDTSGSNGADAADSDHALGLEQLLNENAHLMLAAGLDDTVITNELKAHVETASTDKIKRDRIAIVGSRANATLPQILGHNVSSDRMIFVAPGIKTTDSASGKEVTLSGAYAAAAVAGMLSSRDPHISLTNKDITAAGLETKFSPGQLEQLVTARVLALEERRGFKVVKGITTDNGAFRQITTRRIVDFAKAGVRSAAEPFIGLLNNDRVRKALKGSINGFLASMVDDEMLVSYELEVTATRDEEIRGIARVIMTVRPTFSIDFIKVTMFLG